MYINAQIFTMDGDEITDVSALTLNNKNVVYVAVELRDPFVRPMSDSLAQEYAYHNK